jgi:polysaccharide export outer membrane protein
MRLRPSTKLKCSPRVPVLAAALALASACAHVGNYIPVDDYRDPAASAGTEYIIATGDLLSVRVFSQDSLSGKARVRKDGKISLPLVNDTEAAGLSPSVLARQIQAKLKDYIKDPVVTVSLEEAGPIEVSVLGEVGKPGVYRVEPRSGVLYALAMSGGLGQYASRDRIFVIRRAMDGKALVRIRFDYEKLTKGEGPAATFHMRDGDLLVVE